MRKTLAGATTAVFVLILAACGNPSLLVPEIQDQNPVKIDSIQSGSVVTGNADIPIRLVYSSSYSRSNGGPDNMQIKLQNPDGSDVRTFAIGQSALSTQDSFTLNFPNLPAGLYTLVVTLYEQGKVLQEQKIDFFLVQGNYRFTGISSFPSSFYPGSAGLLQAHVDVPAGTDPYLRWTMNEKTIAAGLLSSGADQVLVRAPAVEGAYNVTVEMFPAAPAGKDGFPFTSSIKQSTELFVSKTQNVGEHELGPEQSYYSLFHFRGDYRDEGERTRLADANVSPARAIGNPDLRISGSIFGYHLDGSSGFRVNEVLLPFAGSRLSPFSVTIRAMADIVETNRTLFSATSADGNFGFKLRTDGNGFVVADITSNGSSATAESGQMIFTPGDAVLFNVSVAPGPSATQLLWFKDGTPLGASTVPIGFGSFPSTPPQWKISAGTSTIGVASTGPNDQGSATGFVGILDEFGIYFRDASLRPSTDNRIFHGAMSATYGDALDYAEGFEGLFLPDGVTTQGPVTVGSGELVLSPGSSVVFPRFLFQHEDLMVELALDNATTVENGRVSFTAVSFASTSGSPADSPAQFIAVDTAGLVRIPAAQLEAIYRNKTPQPLSRLERDAEGNYVVPLSSPVVSPFAIRFSHTDNGLNVQIEGDEYSLRSIAPGFGGIRMSLSQDAGRKLSFKVRSVLARKEGADLSSTLNALMPKDSATRPSP
ncbi:MAG TPA: hypothetical protein VMW87_09435 [Spirochaetia bacterium]|nr:hypothetical protein [Spirochaetia bacterium]